MVKRSRLQFGQRILLWMATVWGCGCFIQLLEITMALGPR